MLYGLHELRAMAPTSPLGRGWIVLVEGEKDVRRLRALGIPATTNPGGAGKWLDDYFEQLFAAHVRGLVLLPDHDEPGQEAHARGLPPRARVQGVRLQVARAAGLPDKGDVSDWLTGGPA